MRNPKACCFSGHRNEKLPTSIEAIVEGLSGAIEQAISDGFTTFYHGGCNGIDLMAAELVLQFRESNDNIRLFAILPYEEQANDWTEDWRDRYFTVLEKCDEVLTLHTKFVIGCYQERNKYMVDRSSRLIAVYDGTSSGGTKNTIAYAQKQGVEIKIIQT